MQRRLLLQPTYRHAFTLLELLVSIGVIGVLVAILVGVVHRARGQAKALACQSNVRQLMGAALLFAADHDGHLPGNSSTASLADPDPDHRDWLTLNANWQTGPEAGTLWKYTNQNYSVYRCPMETEVVPGAGVESNGKDDYAYFACFAGAMLKSINPSATLTYPDGHTEIYPTPVFCQEDPTTINKSNMEGRHSSIDEMAHVHFGGSYYGAVDGSVQFLKEPINPANAGSNQWTSLAPKSNTMVKINFDAAWGDWARK